MSPDDHRSDDVLTRPIPSSRMPQRIGQYEIVRLIGRGGMGSVYEAWHPRLQRKVAIKVLQPQLLDTPELRRRFERETVAIGQLTHPHLVHAYDAGEEEGSPYIVMQFVTGINVDMLIRRLGPLPIDAACAIAHEAALGLAHAHQEKLVHRDVKPSNLLIDEAGVVRVADLGLARYIDDPKHESLTHSGLILGTIDYLSPEQAEGRRDVSNRSDVYSLGCTLYFLLVGEVPFPSSRFDSEFKKLQAHLQGKVPLLRQLRAEVPRSLEQLVEQMTAKDAVRRPAAAEVAKQLLSSSNGAALAPLVKRAISETNRADDVLHPGSTSRLVSTVAHIPASSTTAQSWRSRTLWLAGMIIIVAIGLTVRFQLGEKSLANVAMPDAASQNDQARSDGEKRRIDGVPAIEAEDPQPIHPPQTPAEKCFEDLKVDDIKPLIRYGLLNREPATLSWRSSPLGVRKFDPNLHQFRASTAELGMFALGTTHSANYTFQTDLYQNRWPGGIGVFWGLQPVIDEEMTRWRTQVLLFQQRRFGSDVRELPLCLTRLTWTLRMRPDGTFDAQQSALTSVNLPRPDSKPCLLELNVTRQGLTTVRFDGQDEPLRKLGKVEVNEQLALTDYIGQFGLIVLESEGVAQNASILFHE